MNKLLSNTCNSDLARRVLHEQAFRKKCQKEIREQLQQAYWNLDSYQDVNGTVDLDDEGFKLLDEKISFLENKLKY